MGCFNSKVSEYNAKLTQVQEEVGCQPWAKADGQGLDEFSRCVQNLREVYTFFSCERQSKDKGSLAQIQRVADTLTADLCELMDVPLLRSGNRIRIQEILKLSKELDTIRATKASAEVEGRYKNLQKALATEYLTDASSVLAQMNSPDQLLDSAQKVLRFLQKAQEFMTQVPNMVKVMLQHSNALSKRILDMVGPALDSGSCTLNALEDVAASLDRMCSEVVKIIGSSWEPLATQLIAAVGTLSKDVLPSKLDALEAELSKKDGVNLNFLKRSLADISPWCVNMGEETKADFGEACEEYQTKARLTKNMQEVKRRLVAAFDKALDNGLETTLNELLNFAQEYDKQCEKMSMPFTMYKELAKKKAGVTLEALMGRARGSLQTQTEQLSKAAAQAEEDIKRIPKDKHADKAGPPIWRFKLRSGVWKDFPEAASAEVEESYQYWLKQGSPTAIEERRCEISIEVEVRGAAAKSSKSATEKTSTGSSRKRERCKFGDKCYRKNAEHRQQFSHPGDKDWDEKENSSVEAPPSASDVCGPASMREEKFSLDFNLMTQVNLSRRAAMRPINRHQGLTKIQLATKAYFDQVRDYVQGFAGMFSQADREMRLLGARERTEMQSEVDALLEGIGPSVKEFMSIAVRIEDIQAVEEIVALLGPRGEALGLDEELKELRLNDVLNEMRQAYMAGFGAFGKATKTKSWSVLPTKKESRWTLLRFLVKQKLFFARTALRRTQQEFKEVDRRRGQMRSQALLLEYSKDTDFCDHGRSEIGKILASSLESSIQDNHVEDASDIIKTAVGLGCETNSMVDETGQWMASAVSSACKSPLGLARVVEIFDLGINVCKALGTDRNLETMLDIPALVPKLAQRALQEIEGDGQGIVLVSGIAKGDCEEKKLRKIFAGCGDIVNILVPREGRGKPTGVAYIAFKTMAGCNAAIALSGKPAKVENKGLPSSVKRIVGLYLKLGHATKGFDDAFWELYQAWYTKLPLESQAGAIEWAIAYCEQLKVPLPKWMMKNDKVEAMKKLQSALEIGNEQVVREAVIFAKQTDYKSEAKLVSLYDEAMNKLRGLKRLPSGWQAEELVGTDASAKMFKKMDFSDPTLKGFFQKLFDSTKASITTRDRTGAVPRGYRVERIVSVMNGDAWFSYIGRRDKIQEQCGRVKGVAPMPASVWDTYSGEVETCKGTLHQDILANCMMPQLETTANEFLLFHGTKPAAAELIVRDNFDMGFACKTGLFGAGLYFAESCSKADEYVQPDEKGHMPLIICRVTLGKINYCPNSDPIKDPGRVALETSCTRGEYHSVIGDRKKARGTYREFIVYDNFQVYPTFIVWYSRL